MTVQTGATFWADGWVGTVSVAANGKLKGSGTITNLIVSSNSTVKISVAATSPTNAWNTAGKITFAAGSQVDVADLGVTNGSSAYYLIRGTSVTGTPTLVGATGLSVTNANNAIMLIPSLDTDADGLTDYLELTQYFTDPNNRDTDGDGINDNVDPEPVGTWNLAAPSPTSTFSGNVTNSSTLAIKLNLGLAVDYLLVADRKSTRLNSSHVSESRMPSSA